jgi:hypothetical protein
MSSCGAACTEMVEGCQRIGKYFGTSLSEKGSKFRGGVLARQGSEKDILICTQVTSCCQSLVDLIAIPKN